MMGFEKQQTPQETPRGFFVSSPPSLRSRRGITELLGLALDRGGARRGRGGLVMDLEVSGYGGRMRATPDEGDDSLFFLDLPWDLVHISHAGGKGKHEGLQLCFSTNQVAHDVAELILSSLQNRNKLVSAIEGSK